MKSKKVKSMILAGLVATSLQASASEAKKEVQNDKKSPKLKAAKKKNHFVFEEGYKKLVTDDETINELNLEAVKVKLMDEVDGPGWTLEQADIYGEKYRAYLYLVKKYPDLKIVPSKEVDEVWHTHILDTYKYHEDCQKIFGQYLHHFPYFGMRNEDDRIDLEESFKATVEIYKKEFPAEFSKEIIQREALCIGEKPGKCAIREEIVKAALCIGERPGKCAVREEVVKAALCIGERPGKCAVKEEAVYGTDKELFRDRIRPRIDRLTGKAFYQE